MSTTPQELIKIRDRLRLLDSGIRNELDIYYPYYLEDCIQFNYVAAMPAYIETAKIILDEVHQKISSISTKKHLIFRGIKEYIEAMGGIHILGDENMFQTKADELEIIVVDDDMRKQWYKKIMPELQEYDKLLLKHKIGVLPQYYMSDDMAVWISKFEVGENKCLLANEKSQQDFISLVTSSQLTASEISSLNIKLGTDNKVSAYILRELDNSDFLKINFRAMEKMGCFFAKSGIPFSAANFEADLSKFKTSLNTSVINNELVTEINDKIFKLLEIKNK